VIEPFGKSWLKEWFTYDLSGNWARKTHKVYDPQFKAPAGAKLSIEVKTEQANKMVIGLDNHATDVELKGGADWQTVILTTGDFINGDEEKLSSWEGIKELRLGARESLRPKKNSKAKDSKPKNLGGEWKGSAPEFRNLKWVTEIK